MQARFNIVVALLSALVAVVMSSTAPDLINFRAKNLFPHGFEWHKTKNAFLVGSLTTGQVYTVTDDATVTQFTTDSRLYQRSAQGLELDYTRSQLLIALGNSSAANLEQFEWAKNAFARADISTGEVTAFVDLDAVKLESYKGTSLAGDLAVDSNGNVYICETRGGFIWKVDKQNNVTVYASHPDWTPEAQYIPGIKGMVYSNGNLLVSKQGEGKLFRVTVEADGVSPNITYVSFPSGIPDYFSGITLRENGNLIVVGRPPSTGLSPFIYEIESNDNWVTAAIKYTVNATRSEPITAIPRENDVFVLHAYLNDFLAGRESFDITKAPYPISEQTTAASSTPEPSTDESGAPSQSGICVLVALIAAFLQLLL